MIFVIQDDGVVTKHYDRVHTQVFIENLMKDAEASRPLAIVGALDDMPTAGSHTLTTLYGLIDVEASKNFDGFDRKGVYDALLTRYADLAFMEPTVMKAPETPIITVAEQVTSTEEENTDMQTQTETVKAPKATKTAAPKATAKTKTAIAKAPKAAVVKVPRGKGKDAGKVADFKQVLKGSKRGNILELMTGKHTAKDIAAKLGIADALVSSNVFCLSRDCAIGYSYGPKGELTALFPGSKTMADALKVAGTPPKAKAAAKPKAAAKAK